jgi:sec-independent protein translocase protein TatA
VFNIGPGEIILILILALLVFGPKKLPEVGRTVGKSLREFQRATRDIKDQLDLGLDDDDEEPAPPGATVVPADTAASDLEADDFDDEELPERLMGPGSNETEPSWPDDGRPPAAAEPVRHWSEAARPVRSDGNPPAARSQARHWSQGSDSGPLVPQQPGGTPSSPDGET